MTPFPFSGRRTPGISVNKGKRKDRGNRTPALSGPPRSGRSHTPERKGRSHTPERKYLTWRDGLRFPVRRHDFGGDYGLLDAVYGWGRFGVAQHDVVRESFGIRFVPDERELTGFSIVVTRKPLDYWLGALQSFYPARMSPERFDIKLEGVSPRGVAGEDGTLAFSWRCPSLLKALYLMLYLDELAGTKLQKCKMPDCPEYYRPGPRPSKYCPPPQGKKQSKCASKASSRAHRQREKKP
jgi:hypothetical protein